LRYFNVFGPKQALDDEYAVVVPKFIHCIINDEPPPIFGTGKQSRDFTYIENVVSANILAATTPGIKHDVFNVANGQDNTVLELVVLLNKIIGKNIKPEFLPVRAGDVFRTSADISRIQEKIGYKPLVGFEEGLRKTTAYFQAQ
jgi:UDP-glucose 4-epimerase